MWEGRERGEIAVAGRDSLYGPGLGTAVGDRSRRATICKPTSARQRARRPFAAAPSPSHLAPICISLCERSHLICLENLAPFNIPTRRPPTCIYLSELACAHIRRRLVCGVRSAEREGGEVTPGDRLSCAGRAFSAPPPNPSRPSAAGQAGGRERVRQCWVGAAPLRWTGGLAPASVGSCGEVGVGNRLGIGRGDLSGEAGRG